MATHQARRGFVAFTERASAGSHRIDAANLKSASRQGQPWRLAAFGPGRFGGAAHAAPRPPGLHSNGSPDYAWERALSNSPTGVGDMADNRYYGVRVEGAKYGVGFGSALAIAISYNANHSILWAIIHGILGWLYVIYFALFRS
jgi:hypothetical protein